VVSGGEALYLNKQSTHRAEGYHLLSRHTDGPVLTLITSTGDSTLTALWAPNTETVCCFSAWSIFLLQILCQFWSIRSISL